MIYQILADLAVMLHLIFIVFALAGGFLVVWRSRFALAHLPAAIWIAHIEISGSICPLTPLENQLRIAGGAEGYSGGFIAHYITPVIYPVGLTAEIQSVLGFIVIGVNLGFYGFAIYRHLHSSSAYD